MAQLLWSGNKGRRGRLARIGLEVASQALDLTNARISDATLGQLDQSVAVEAGCGADVRPTALARLWFGKGERVDVACHRTDASILWLIHQAT